MRSGLDQPAPGGGAGEALLDAAAVARWCHTGLELLAEHRAEVDALNVFPVDDGDTGTNLVSTWQSVAAALAAVSDAAPEDGRRRWAAVAEGALMGARGNSGVILAQLLAGVRDVLGTAARPGGRELAAALARGADEAYRAVAEPVEGTMLTVARAAAVAAGEAGPGLEDVVRAAVRAAEEALERTPDQLPVLARAGVVDAGGRGLVLLLEALLAATSGEAVHDDPPPVVARVRGRDAVEREGDGAAFAYEVQYLLEAAPPAVEELRATLAPLGDSLVVVGGPQTWNVHVHVDDPGAAVEAGVVAGRPRRITITRFADQQPGAPPARATDATGTGRAVLAVTAGDELAELFRGEGAHVVPGGPGANPSTAELVAAIEATGAREVVVLPNDPNVLPVARQAAAAILAAAPDRTVAVVPSKAMVQGLAALAVADAERPFGDVVIAMSAAAAATRAGELTTAARDAQTSVGVVRAGQALGLLDGDVVLAGDELPATAMRLVDRMLDAGGELLTLLCGRGCPPELPDAVRAHVRAARPFVEVCVYDGGQEHYPLLLGVE